MVSYRLPSVQHFHPPFSFYKEVDVFSKEKEQKKKQTAIILGCSFCVFPLSLGIWVKGE